VDAAAAEGARTLIGAYIDAVDRGQAHRIAELFTDDGVLEIRGDSFDAGRYEGRTAIEDRFKSSGQAFAGLPQTTYVRHHVSSVRIREDSDDVLVSDSYFLAVTDRGPDHWGRYSDRVVHTGDGWRFAARVVVHEGSNPGSFVEVLPR
jgi:uncharacterized protein (TIGR02246 family)